MEHEQICDLCRDWRLGSDCDKCREGDKNEKENILSSDETKPFDPFLNGLGL